MDILKKIKLLDFKLKKSIGNLLFGSYKSKFYGNGIDFSEHREYNFGDSIKNIDWKASSRGGKIYNKLFEEDRDLKVLFLFDLRKSMFFQFAERTKKDIIEEVFYSLAFSAYKNNDNIGTFLFSENESIFIPFKKSLGNVFETLKIIEKIGFEAKKIKYKNNYNSIKDFLETIKKRNIRDSLIFILSDDLEIENSQVLLRNLNFENEVVFVSVFDYFENNLEKINSNLILQNGFESLQVNLNNKEKIKNYSKNRFKKIGLFKKLLKKNGISSIYLDTKKDIFKELYLYFNK